MKRFQREIDTTSGLKHKNIVNLHDFFWEDNNFYLILDYCQNGELMDYIIKNKKIAEPTAALIFEQMVSAIAYCHSFGVAHRDLKPENVLFEKFPLVKVSDFGLCGYMEESKLMQTFCGSPCYSAPECLRQYAYDGQKSDIWSLGVNLYLMVTGMHPWNVTNINVMLREILDCTYTIPKDVSAECRDLISKILVLEPEKRLTIDQIIKHPWLKCAEKANVLQKQGIKHEAPKLPKLQQIKFAEMAKSSKPEGESECGISAPIFLFPQAGSVMPSPLVRSPSNVNMKEKVSFQRISIPNPNKFAGIRQRSVGAIVRPKLLPE
ncbi:CAMK family protein kinase [Trichomonas vaginalis G3]|uniref:CAMK family protein kinase n=1 Tax=Trichomonas vaginalis (strain ATCC PRA-98 / G3) TaxID=412133 RepID=A2DWM4_TRIV3|nr:protein serine/threonine kinase protein [Trichomonas vaginalis G3]EAY15209.1 CAMK family protein kinase [Trichomonas vaginalis G3]KAI5550637.1 protein serine/threonine kinase protein [Trichomonas vaginalis G3]|eukprot:XP_001327432.1 CAMK family protein kinase [Trichomonas vaginalis G3]